MVLSCILKITKTSIDQVVVGTLGCLGPRPPRPRPTRPPRPQPPQRCYRGGCGRFKEGAPTGRADSGEDRYSWSISQAISIHEQKKDGEVDLTKIINGQVSCALNLHLFCLLKAPTFRRLLLGSRHPNPMAGVPPANQHARAPLLWRHSDQP